MCRVKDQQWISDSANEFNRAEQDESQGKRSLTKVTPYGCSRKRGCSCLQGLHGSLQRCPLLQSLLTSLTPYHGTILVPIAFHRKAILRANVQDPLQKEDWALSQKNQVLPQPGLAFYSHPFSNLQDIVFFWDVAKVREGNISKPQRPSRCSEPKEGHVDAGKHECLYRFCILML